MAYTRRELTIGIKALVEEQEHSDQVVRIMQQTGYSWDEAEALLARAHELYDKGKTQTRIIAEQFFNLSEFYSQVIQFVVGVSFILIGLMFGLADVTLIWAILVGVGVATLLDFILQQPVRIGQISLILTGWLLLMSFSLLWTPIGLLVLALGIRFLLNYPHPILSRPTPASATVPSSSTSAVPATAAEHSVESDEQHSDQPGDADTRDADSSPDASDADASPDQRVSPASAADTSSRDTNDATGTDTDTSPDQRVSPASSSPDTSDADARPDTGTSPASEADTDSRDTNDAAETDTKDTSPDDQPQRRAE
jgi:hypothetical protein